MEKQAEKSAFSERLKTQLSKRGWPTSSPTWLSREFNIRYSGTSVSVQAANNWLSGNAIPNQDKLQVLSAWLDVSTQWLRFGENAHTSSQNESTIDLQPYTRDYSDLPKKLAQLSPIQKQVVYDVIEAILGKK